jgi:hypothetical protein
MYNHHKLSDLIHPVRVQGTLRISLPAAVQGNLCSSQPVTLQGALNVSTCNSLEQYTYVALQQFKKIQISKHRTACSLIAWFMYQSLR